MDNLIKFQKITRLQLSKKILATIKATQRELERAVRCHNQLLNYMDVPIQVKHSYVCFPKEDENLRYLVDGMETQDLVELCDDVILSISARINACHKPTSKTDIQIWVYPKPSKEFKKLQNYLKKEAGAIVDDCDIYQKLGNGCYMFICNNPLACTKALTQIKVAKTSTKDTMAFSLIEKPKVHQGQVTILNNKGQVKSRVLI
jgi:hypothetical protein